MDSIDFQDSSPFRATQSIEMQVTSTEYCIHLIQYDYMFL